MKCVVTKWLPMPIPETPVKVLGDNENWVLADFYFPSAFFVFFSSNLNS